MRIPVATYRLQISPDFNLRDAANITAYLSDLGISDLYLSPVFEARPGSSHGYDITDPTSIRAEIGGRAAFAALAEQVRQRGMGLLLDIVPNHMAASEHGGWWRDLLRRGRVSRFARFFDIDWGGDQDPDQLRLPILDAPLSEVLRQERLQPVAEAGEWHLRYGGRRLPLTVDEEDERDLAAFPGTPASRRVRILRRLLDRQHYRLVHWAEAGQRPGYRRFFDINDLAGVRVEDTEVFAATHALVLELLTRAEVTGLRVDHIDGLRDPAAYLERLRAAANCYLVVEKVLERNEHLPPWPVDGTTGYDFLNLANGLFVDPAGHALIERSYQRLTGQQRSFAEVVRAKKLLVLERLFAGERSALALQLQALLGPECDLGDAERILTEITVALPVYRTYIGSLEPHQRDRGLLEYVLAASRLALPDLPADLVSSLSRTLLLQDESTRPAALKFLLGWQQLTGPVMAKGLEDTALYVHTAFIAANEVGADAADPAISVATFHQRMKERFQSFPHSLNATATHDTKRGEDTRARLDVLSEIAADWTRVLRSWASRSEQPKGQALASAGLDEDAPVPNAREESLLYQTLLGTWPLGGEADPGYIARIKRYMVKALREAKETTSWRNPDPDYEVMLAAFVDQLLDEPWWPDLSAEIRAYAGAISWPGALNALSQVLLKTTCPGVPDFYQGTELWSLSLVDPDNRQPVDYALRRSRLRALEPLLARPSPAGVAGLLEHWRTGDVKLFLIAAALRFRRHHAELFASGEYLPLTVRGRAADHVVAFARVAGRKAVIVLATRLLATLCQPGCLPDQSAWADTTVELGSALGGRNWRNIFTGEQFPANRELPLAALLQSFPLALLN